MPGFGGASIPADGSSQVHRDRAELTRQTHLLGVATPAVLDAVTTDVVTTRAVTTDPTDTQHPDCRTVTFI
jgi:hypothetical protein